MRASSPPTVLLIAAVACEVLAAVPALPAIPSVARAEHWPPPVPGQVARAFSYAGSTPFAAGAHRGVDLDAPPGTVVRAACSGRVVHAGVVAGRERVVSTNCGARRVTYLPLASVAIRAGEGVRAGATIGTVAAGHGGLHVGVRREADHFAYVDPMRLFARHERPFAPAPRPAVPRFPGPRSTGPRLAPRPATPRLAPRSSVPRSGAPEPAVSPTGGPGSSTLPAPWPVWAGLALLLCGSAGSGTVAVRRRRRAAATVRATSTA